MKKYFKIICAILILSLLILPAGCKKKPTPQKKPQTTQKASPPKELSKIEQDIDKIIKEAQKTAKKPAQQGQQEGQAKQQKEKKNSKEKGNEQKKSEGGEQQKANQQSPEQKSWDTITKTVKDIHTNWNILNPIAVKAGAKPNLINSMSTAINDLTSNASQKSKIAVMMSANNVYKYIPDIEDLFKTEIPTDVKRLKYYTTDIAFNGETEKWDLASKDLTDLNAVWKSLKPKLPKEAKTAIDKFEAGLLELEKAVKSKDKTITKIKSDVLMSDIKSIEKSSKPKK